MPSSIHGSISSDDEPKPERSCKQCERSSSSSSSSSAKGDEDGTAAATAEAGAGEGGVEPELKAWIEDDDAKFV
ncbi:unnamed protein product [Anisakis simplex]|uniref:Uncharacterized protein n=1 Tax=Anisakis simplex TaxID=6269 RepID=A0A0M3JWJ4_ANISI|nr:unnamed protein product [Anisakis simplex]